MRPGAASRRLVALLAGLLLFSTIVLPTRAADIEDYGTALIPAVAALAAKNPIFAQRLLAAVTAAPRQISGAELVRLAGLARKELNVVLGKSGSQAKVGGCGAGASHGGCCPGFLRAWVLPSS